MARTEEEKLVQAPIVLVLGGAKYEVRPLVIKESREWREKLAALISSLPQYVNVTTDAPDQFGDAVSAILVTMPDAVVDLVFLYAKDLNREEIEAVATDAEVATAFEQIVEVAFPLAKGLTGAMTKLSQ